MSIPVRHRIKAELPSSTGTFSSWLARHKLGLASPWNWKLEAALVTLDSCQLAESMGPLLRREAASTPCNTTYTSMQ